jgi:thiol:disulfide interchange protein DsbA
MKIVRRFTVAALLVLSVGTCWAAAQAGKDYSAISPPQPTDTPGKVEVIEFFSYACPHCSHLEPALEAWAQKLPAGAVLHRIPVTFGRNEWVSLAKLYFSLEVMGNSDKLNGKVFHAIHEDKVNLSTADACADWVAKQGVDRQHFVDVYNSFAVQTRLQRANMKAQAYAVDGVPTLIIDGRFRTSPAMAGGNEGALAVSDELIQLSGKDKALHK